MTTPTSPTRRIAQTPPGQPASRSTSWPIYDARWPIPAGSPTVRSPPLRARTRTAKFARLPQASRVRLIGTDRRIPTKFPHQFTWRELDLGVDRLGVEPMADLRAATDWPTVAMKVDQDVGTIHAGKFADRIAEKGDGLRSNDVCAGSIACNAPISSFTSVGRAR